MSGTWLNRLKKNPIDWLLSGNPWTRYMTLTELLEKEKDSADAVQAMDDLKKTTWSVDLWMKRIDGSPSLPKGTMMHGCPTTS